MRPGGRDSRAVTVPRSTELPLSLHACPQGPGGQPYGYPPGQPPYQYVVAGPPPHQPYSGPPPGSYVVHTPGGSYVQTPVSGPLSPPRSPGQPQQLVTLPPQPIGDDPYDVDHCAHCLCCVG